MGGVEGDGLVDITTIQMPEICVTTALSHQIFYYYPGGTSADFRGACARHDICYFDVKESGGASSGFANCNRQLRDNLRTVCRNVYSNEYWIRNDCVVVVTVHPTHWPGHLGG